MSQRSMSDVEDEELEEELAAALDVGGSQIITVTGASSKLPASSAKNII
jgi:hypothetical protein